MAWKTNVPQVLTYDFELFLKCHDVILVTKSWKELCDTTGHVKHWHVSFHKLGILNPRREVASISSVTTRSISLLK